MKDNTVDIQDYLNNIIKVYRKLAFNFTHHFFLWGSRKSGKSMFVLAYTFMCCALFPNLSVMIIRHIDKDIRDTTFENYKNAIDFFGMRDLILKDDERKIVFKNGSKIKYKGMKGKELSIKNLEVDLYIYEEAEQSLRKEYTALKTNLRDGTKGVTKSFDGEFTFNKKMIFCLNPPEFKEHYLNVMFENEELYEDSIFLKTNIEDNPFATEQDYKDLDEIKMFDECDYLRYRYGLIALRKLGLLMVEDEDFSFITKREFIYYTRLTKKEKQVLAKELKVSPDIYLKVKTKELRLKDNINVYGGDFSSGTGQDCLAFLDVFINFKLRHVYVRDIIFDNTLHDPKLIIQELERRGVLKHIIQFWDNQNTLTINTIKSTFPKARECKKTLILDGINVLKTFKIFIYASEEFKTVRKIKQKAKQLPLKEQIVRYSRKYNKISESYLREPEKDAKNMGIDFWDALRYAVISYMLLYNKK